MKKGKQIGALLASALLALSCVSVSADMNPSLSSAFTEGYSLDFTQEKLNGGKDFTIEKNGNPALTSDGYSVDYTTPPSQGVRFRSTAANGLVNGDATIPVEATGLGGITGKATYYYEFLLNVADFNNTVRIYAKCTYQNSTALAIRLTGTSIGLYAQDNSNYSAGSVEIPEAMRQQDIRLGIGIAAAQAYGDAQTENKVYLYLNGERMLSVNNIKGLDRSTNSAIQFHFMGSDATTALVLKSFRSFIKQSTEADAYYVPENTTGYDPASDQNFTAGANINFTTQSNGTTLNWTPKADCIVEDVVEGQPSMTLTATEDGGLPNVTVIGKTGTAPNSGWWGTNGSYTLYWEFTMNLSALPDSDAYRWIIHSPNGSKQPSPIATVSIGKKELSMGFRNDLGSSKPGYIGAYKIPAAVQTEDIRIGVSYHQPSYTLALYVNGEPILSKSAAGTEHETYLGNIYADSREMELYCMQRDKAGDSLTLKGFRAGYIVTSKIGEEAPLDASVSFSGTLADARLTGTTTATATLSKTGGTAYCDRVVLWVAVYDGNTLVSADCNSGIVWGGESGKELSLDVSGIPASGRVSAFLWRCGTLQPLTEAGSLN